MRTIALRQALAAVGKTDGRCYYADGILVSCVFLLR